MKYIPVIIAWSLWCGLHSGMISLTVTGYLKKKLGDKYRFYRLFYNSVALATLLAVTVYSHSVRGPVLFCWHGLMTVMQVALFSIVMALLISGALKYDMLQFFGIRQIKSGKSHATLSASGDLDTSGILGLVRHPWYLAALIFIWISYRELDISTLIRSIILTAYVVIGAFLEERKLVIDLGDHYRDYQKKVSMFFPVKWIASKLSTTH
jgi:protein-S-isoprenylcysteine O-methyltransferase Ste14